MVNKVKSYGLSLLFILIHISCEDENEQVVDIDGNVYPVIAVNMTTWMAQNLEVTSDRKGNNVNYFFPNENTELVETYGLLYDYENACKVCPKGWRLPTNQEWEELLRFQTTTNADDFKDSQFWDGEQNTNGSNFSARPAGIGNSQEHPNRFGELSIFWSVDKEEDHFIWSYRFEKESDEIIKASQHPTYAFSVRCVKE